MFTVNEYKIVFKRISKALRESKSVKVAENDGRYDTKCEIYVQDKTMVGKGFRDVYKKEPSFTGIAKLHPNDKPDKVVGKKIALFRAMGLYYEEASFYDAFGAETKGMILRCSNDTFKAKDLRAAIWWAFWKWVDSWKKDPKINI